MAYTLLKWLTHVTLKIYEYSYTWLTHVVVTLKIYEYLRYSNTCQWPAHVARPPSPTTHASEHHGECAHRHGCKAWNAQGMGREV